MRYAINNINKANKILFGTKLGYRIYDTCRSTLQMKMRASWLTSFRNPEGAYNSPFVGIIGPSTSIEARLSYPLFQRSRLPVVSYSARSEDLSNNILYKLLFRTVPDNSQQAGALLDIIKHFKWKFISTVNSHNYFVRGGMDLTIELLKAEGICFSSRNVLPQNPSQQDYDYVIKNLKRNPVARVVVLFTTPNDTQMLLKLAGPNSKFQWLSSSAWDANMQAVEGVREAAKGAILLNYVNINNKE